jgi:hypothetical protein
MTYYFGKPSPQQVFHDLDRTLEALLPKGDVYRSPRAMVLELVAEYGAAIRREIALLDEIRKYGT